MGESIESVFGRTVRRYREKLGVSQEEFADTVGVHRTYVSLIERGKVQVSIGIAHKVANGLRVPLSKLWREIERQLPAEPSSSESGTAGPLA
jgi:transcriptional regulator with XRE-family HTH domain